jgi:sn-glycerol 3-phosphate transport system substrate-binding protein
VRAVVAGAVLAAGALLAGACGPPPTTGGGSGVATVTPTKLPPCPLAALQKHQGKVTVVVWYGALGGELGTTMQDLVKKFNASQDKVVVDARNQGKDYDEVLAKYESAAATSPGSLPGLVYLEDGQLRNLVDSHNVLPAQSCMKADGYDLGQIVPAVRAYYTVNDVYWPAYANVSTPVLYYNKAHFQKAGLDPNDPPQTLQEVEAAAKKLKAAGVSKTPFAINLDRWYFEVWVNGAGGDLVNNGNGRDAPATASVFDNAQAKQLFASLQRMRSEGLLQPFSNTPGQINQYLALAQQQASMTLGTSAAANTIKAFLKGTLTSAESAGIDTSADDLAKAQIVPAAAAFPGLEEPGKVRVSGGAFFILNKSKPEVQAASWEFAKFMLQPENAAYWNLHGGYLPMVKAAVQLPEVQTYWDDDLAGQMSKVAFDQLGAVDVFQPGPLIGPYTAWSDGVEKMWDSTLLGSTPPDKALANGEKSTTEVLKAYNG